MVQFEIASRKASRIVRNATTCSRYHNTQWQNHQISARDALTASRCGTNLIAHVLDETVATPGMPERGSLVETIATTTVDTDQGRETAGNEITDATEARRGGGTNHGVMIETVRGIENLMIAEEDEAYGTLVMIEKEALSNHGVRPRIL